MMTMEICNGTRIDSELEDTASSHLESLTRIIPEDLVSVKLESSDNTAAYETEGVHYKTPPNALRMQNNGNVGQRSPSGFSKAGMPEFSAWVHTNQIPPENQHLSSYLAHESNSKLINTNLKIGNNGISGLVNGDICDSNTFLNYVLNQQRSNGIFVFDPRSNVEPPSQVYSTNCHNCEQQKLLTATKIRNTDTAATYCDASTNTPAKYCLDHESGTNEYESKNECLKCKIKTQNNAERFYNQLGLQPQKNSKFESLCKICDQVNLNPNTTICDNCHETPMKSNMPCKCIQDCNSRCVKNNRRLHFLDIDRPFTCEICLKNYPSESSLVNHLRYHKGSRPYQCETCNKAFATNSHLTTHKRTHSGEKPFECPECFKTFSDRSSFVKHSRTHGPDGTTVKKFKCPICSNMFVDSCGLKKHIRIHTGERPYVCGVCDKAFATSSTFVAHKRIHSGERPYSCPTCSKRFITKSHLLTHSRVHSGEKPFSCQVCNRAFADGSSYRRHERLHTGENRYTCDVCGKGFPYETSLAKHKQSHVPGTSTYVYMTV